MGFGHLAPVGTIAHSRAPRWVPAASFYRIPHDFLPRLSASFRLFRQGIYRCAPGMKRLSDDVRQTGERG
ncbi:hypothetical protein PAFU01_28450 [Pantoea ananatis]|nr:hypothetical protein PAFU01_28450 [Pantoea ananatis]